MDLCGRYVEGCGVPSFFRRWVMECVSTVSYQINVNGILTDVFVGKKGLRQGDLMCPHCLYYIWNIWLSYWSLFNIHLVFSTIQDAKDIKLTHLVFADDLLLFCKGNLNSVKTVMGKFELFTRTSGLKANLGKSELDFACVKADMKNSTVGMRRLK